MKCFHCQQDIPAGAKFCPECGTRISGEFHASSEEAQSIDALRTVATSPEEKKHQPANASLDSLQTLEGTLEGATSETETVNRFSEEVAAAAALFQNRQLNSCGQALKPLLAQRDQSEHIDDPENAQKKQSAIVALNKLYADFQQADGYVREILEQVQARLADNEFPECLELCRKVKECNIEDSTSESIARDTQEKLDAFTKSLWDTKICFASERFSAAEKICREILLQYPGHLPTVKLLGECQRLSQQQSRRHKIMLFSVIATILCLCILAGVFTFVQQQKHTAVVAAVLQQHIDKAQTAKNSSDWEQVLTGLEFVMPPEPRKDAYAKTPLLGLREKIVAMQNEAREHLYATEIDAAAATLRERLARIREALDCSDWDTVLAILAAELPAEPFVNAFAAEPLRGILQQLAALEKEVRIGLRSAQIAEYLVVVRSAAARKDWAVVIAAAEKVLALDAGHAEARKRWDEANYQLERTRQEAEHLFAARSAATHKDGAAVSAAAEKVLTLDEAHAEAKELRDQANNHQLRVPAGFRAASGIRPEPYTNTGWAQTIIHEATGIELVYIPAGSFTMGSPKSEQDAMVDAGYKREWAENEFQHRVTISQGFYLGKTEVTQAQWQKLMRNNPSYFKNAGSDAPVDNVSWDDCQKFCQKAGSGLRLPTEAEWEYACRAGTKTALYNGAIKILGESNAPALDPIAWYGGNSGVTYGGGDDSSSWTEKQQNHQRAGTHPVGLKKANAWGLYDMIGNACEWCQDWKGAYPTGAGTDFSGAASGNYRVLRGGGWNHYARNCRSASRYWDIPRIRDRGYGLRVCCSVSSGKIEEVEAKPPKVTGVNMYLVVDLSSGTEARSSYPVSYRSTPPAGGWTDEYKTTKLVLRKISAGTFTMGSPEDELGRESGSTQHQVTLTKDFYVGVFQVTQKQWERVMGNWPSYFYNTSYRDTRPVERVSYENIRGSGAGAGWPANNAVDAGSFFGRLRAKTGLTLDLPTDAQWEYACRAGTTTALNSGKNLTNIESCPNVAEVGRYSYNGGRYPSYSAGGDTSVGTAKVGSYLPNQWGLYDMHGNVYEWCLDWRQIDLGSTAQVDPVGPDAGSCRLLRGGDWYGGGAQNCRSARRGCSAPERPIFGYGFRIAFLPSVPAGR